MVSPWVSVVTSGTITMPSGERRMWGSGESDTSPPFHAVGSPPRSAAQACAASCTVVEKKNAGSQKTSAWKISMDMG